MQVPYIAFLGDSLDCNSIASVAGLDSQCFSVSVLFSFKSETVVNLPSAALNMESMNYHLHMPGWYCLYLSTRDSSLKGHVVPEIRTTKQ